MALSVSPAPPSSPYHQDPLQAAQLYLLQLHHGHLRHAALPGKIQNCEASGFSIEEGTSLAVFSRALAVSSSRISRSSCFRPLVMAGRSAWTNMINLGIHES